MMQRCQCDATLQMRIMCFDLDVRFSDILRESARLYAATTMFTNAGHYCIDCVRLEEAGSALSESIWRAATGWGVGLDLVG